VVPAVAEQGAPSRSPWCVSRLSLHNYPASDAHRREERWFDLCWGMRGAIDSRGGSEGAGEEVLQPQWFKVQGLLQMPPLKSTLLVGPPPDMAAASPRGGVL